METRTKTHWCSQVENKHDKCGGRIAYYMAWGKTNDIKDAIKQTGYAGMCQCNCHKTNVTET